MKILIVDDNDNDRKLLRMILERHGYRNVIEARDGQEGLELAREQCPDLIVSDAMMPRLDGFAFMRAVKMDAALRSIPFVFHSSVYTGNRDEELATRLGAVAFIAKPKEPEEFWTEISVVLDGIAAGKEPSPVDPMAREQDYLREYSGVVAAKLEEKVRELEESLARQKEAQAALWKSERFLHNIIENIPDMIFVKDAQELRYLLFNRAGEELIGRSRDELIGKNDYDLLPPGAAELLIARDRKIIDNCNSIDIREETVRNGDDMERILHTKKIPVPDAAGAPQYLIGISEDITERKRAEEELLKLSSAIEQSPVSIVITDALGNIEFVNSKFTQMTGYLPEESSGENRSIMEWIGASSEEYGKRWETIVSAGVWHGEIRTRREDGESSWEYATISRVKSRLGEMTHYLAVMEDITEMKKLEEQLRHAQKMEAVGTLAAGIAHDFNNILTAIIGFGSILDMKMAADDPLHPNVTQILTAGERAANLTRSLLAFGRTHPLETKQVDLNEVVTGVTKMLRRLLREDVELRTELCAATLPVMVDAGQLEQVLLNLTTNARDAMPGNGTITVSTGLAEPNADLGRGGGQGGGRHALLSFADSGQGMDERTVERIFEPFFTTKEVGKGTGLGLSICYSIVKEHAGYLTCTSAPGQGTTFRIYLPLAAEVAARTEVTPPPPMREGTETILVGEDDPVVRSLTTSILEEFGYRVVQAQDGEEVVAKFLEARGEIALCLLDAIMPKKSGWEAYQEIKGIEPAARALIVSGYQVDSALSRGLVREGAGFLAKPVAPRELLRKVREMLDRP